MDLTHPISTVVRSAHGPVLVVLARAGVPLTGRTIAGLTNPPVSQTQVAAVLAELITTGLVTMTPAGRANLYQINRDHLAYDAVEQLTTLRERLWDKMAAHAQSWAHPPAALVVYGSTARGESTPTSDIDVLVVRPQGVEDADAAWLDDLSAFTTAVTGWTGNSVDLIDASTAWLGELAAAGEQLLAHIRREGRFLIGARSALPA